MRYERKYRIESSSYPRVHHELMSNPCAFSKAYPDRIVNSIYYDDINYSAYNDNLLGIAERVKYRVRWYGASLDFVQKPVLEKKIKKNLLGTKQNTSLNDFYLSEGAIDLTEILNPTVNQLYPYVIVRYLRTYLLSMDGTIRATIDRDLRYINLVNGRMTVQSHIDKGLILEIKYDQDKEVIANQCMQLLPYRMTKNSKYVSAMNYYLH